MHKENTLRIWDPVVRVFHWSFAIIIILAYLSHEWRGARSWHEWLGYTALALALVRIFWGFAGTEYARFSHFLHWPMHYVRYLGELVQGREKRHIGHNPLGGLMILVLLALAIGCGVTGYYMTQRGASLLGLGRHDLERWHSILAHLFVIMVPLHILGVIWESVRHRENLIGAMITGRKRAD